MPIIIRYSREIRNTLRYDGVLILLWRVLTKTLSPLGRVGVEIVFEWDLTEPVEPKRAKTDIIVTEATEADAEAIADTLLGPLPPPDEAARSDADEYEVALRARAYGEYVNGYLRELRGGDKCFIARVGSEVAHVNWTRVRWGYPIPGCAVSLTPDEIYTTDAYTVDARRGQGIHEAVLSEMLARARLVGVRRAYTSTDLIKTGSRRGLVRLGWKPYAKVLYVAPRGLHRTFVLRMGGKLELLLRAAEVGGGEGRDREPEQVT